MTRSKQRDVNVGCNRMTVKNRVAVLSNIPVGQWSLPDLDGAQLLEIALQTHRHVGVWDVEGLPLPAATAGAQAMS